EVDAGARGGGGVGGRRGPGPRCGQAEDDGDDNTGGLGTRGAHAFSPGNGRAPSAPSIVGPDRAVDKEKNRRGKRSSPSGWMAALLPPVLDAEALDPPELALVVGHEDEGPGHGLGGDEHVVGAGGGSG